MRPIIITAALGLALLALGITSFVLATRNTGPQIITPLATPLDPLEPDEHMETLSIPAFTLTDQLGNEATQSILEGHLTIVAFMFTNCPFICPPMGANLRYALEQLQGTSVRVVTFSVDPEHDTPDTLRQYLDTLSADQSRWSFLTGDISVINTILTDGLSLPAATVDTNTPITLNTGAEMANVNHPGYFFLLDPQMNILALYDGTNRELVTQLIMRARLADYELTR
jgi:protein SCO1